MHISRSSNVASKAGILFQHKTCISFQQNLQTAALQQASNFAATNAFAAQQQLPPGYAYFYGQIPNQANIAAAYGAAGAAASGLYPATAMAPVPTGGNNSNKFNQGYGTQRYTHTEATSNDYYRRAHHFDLATHHFEIPQILINFFTDTRIH